MILMLRIIIVLIVLIKKNGLYGSDTMDFAKITYVLMSSTLAVIMAIHDNWLFSMIAIGFVLGIGSIHIHLAQIKIGLRK